MIKKMIFSLGLTMLISACEQEEATQKPENLVSEDKMITFLVDLHIAEAKLGYISVKDRDSLEIIFRNYEQALFEKYDIEDSAYYKSYEYYLSDMEKMHDIYSAVVDSLSILNSMEKTKDLEVNN